MDNNLQPKWDVLLAKNVISRKEQQKKIKTTSSKTNSKSLGKLKSSDVRMMATITATNKNRVGKVLSLEEVIPKLLWYVDCTNEYF